jgi:uncharacterized membrane protein
MKKVILVTLLVFLISLFATFYSFYTFNQHSNESKAIFNYLSIPFYESNIDFLPENELSHMKDVKRLFNITAILSIISIILFIKLKPNIKDFQKSGKNILGIIVSLIAFNLIFGFTKIWNIFHQILFPQGNYEFAYESILIQNFPETFFIKFLSIFTIITIMMSISLIFSSNIYKFIKKN